MKGLTTGAALLIAALPLAPALGQENSAIAAAVAKVDAIVDFYPKPWPLKNLVKPGVLTVALTGESPPGDFIDPKTGAHAGHVHDLYLQIAADLGLKPEFTKIAWAGTLPGLKANRFDMGCAGASWTTARLASEDFHLTSPITVNGTIGLANKAANIATWEQTKGKQLGGVKGELYLEDARKKLAGLGGVTEFPGAPEAFLALENGQVDFVASNISVINNALKNSPNKDNLVVIGPPLGVYPQSLCVNPRETDLLNAVNVLLGNYRANGTLKKLYVKHGAMPELLDVLKNIGY
jgi:ABC-type amino acid transport substrate-binding protein